MYNDWHAFNPCQIPLKFPRSGGRSSAPARVAWGPWQSRRRAWEVARPRASRRRASSALVGKLLGAGGWVLVRGFFCGNTGTNHEQFIWLNSNDLTVRPHWESWFILGKLSPNGLNSGWWITGIYPDSCPSYESSGVEMRNGSSGKSIVLNGFSVTHCWIFLRVRCECSRC